MLSPANQKAVSFALANQNVASLAATDATLPRGWRRDMGQSEGGEVCGVGQSEGCEFRSGQSEGGEVGSVGLGAAAVVVKRRLHPGAYTRSLLSST
jgi:hypothetical protein